MSTPLVSVVVPVYNEQEVLPLFVERLRAVLETSKQEYEVLVVDDGSNDATPALLHRLRREWTQLRIIRLRRNYGHQAALTAGLHRSRGDYVVSIDADLQDPPEKIAEMLQLAKDNSLDIVYGVRDDRTSDSLFKRVTAGLYYKLMRRLAGVHVRQEAGDFRLLSRSTVDVLMQLPEDQPVYRLLVPWLGFPSGEVRYVREKRAAGVSKYPLSTMIRLAFDSIASFSAAPLRIATWLGIFGFVVCLTMLAYTVVSWITGNTVSGWTSLSVAVFFVGAVQLVCLGMLGEYVARIYAGIKKRPLYYVASDTADTE